MEKLPNSLDHTLRVIANNESEALPISDIRKLIMVKLISDKYGGGWMINSKGREYLKKHKVDS